jgi:hypothetical protein
MEFDDLRQREVGSERFGDDNRDPKSWALKQVVTSTVQRQIPFYFAALFHIGRQWKVSESAVSALKKALTGENLRASAVLTLNSLQHDELHDQQLAALFERETGIVVEALGTLLESSEQEHSAQLQASRRWWAEWRDEVSDLSRHVERIGQLADQDPDGRLWQEVSTFAIQGTRPSALRASMEVAGLRFAHLDATGTSHPVAFFSTVLPLLMVALTMSDSGDRTRHDIMYDLRHLVVNITEELRYGEARRVALERLQQKYSYREDPFEAYLPLRKPATEELQNLIIEHTLPGGAHSPWLDVWKRNVAYNSWSTVNLPFKDVHDKTTAEAFARSADCAIKSDLPADFRTGETWTELIQRLFERKWVRPTSIRLVETNKRLGDDAWGLESFVTLIDGVVGAMNDVGYSLSPISRSRLEMLWDHSHSDKAWRDEEW